MIEKVQIQYLSLNVENKSVSSLEITVIVSSIYFLCHKVDSFQLPAFTQRNLGQFGSQSCLTTVTLHSEHVSYFP